MCGIVAYAGKEIGPNELLGTALSRLEYRGYDSWGCAMERADGVVDVFRRLGAPSQSRETMRCAVAMIGHTRWATHGEVSLRNTHPVENVAGDCWVVANGIVEGHERILGEVYDDGRRTSDTDTEAIAAAFGFTNPRTMAEALFKIRQLPGKFSCAIMSRRFPGQVGLVCKGPPLVVSPDGYAASDAAALWGITRTVTSLADGEVAVLGPQGTGVYRKSCEMEDFVDYCEDVPVWAEPSGAGHHMLREIEEQTRAEDFVGLPPLFKCFPRRVVLFGCGSSYNAALFGAGFLRRVGIDATAEYSTDVIEPRWTTQVGTSYLALTQSGETADTLEAMGRVRGHTLRVLTANPRSSAARLAEVVHLRCGPEYGVAATKTFTAQCLALLGMGLHLSRQELPGGLDGAMGVVWRRRGEVAELARRLAGIEKMLFLGYRSYHPVARESALKVKEVSGVWAEAMPAAEVKHGPIALVGPDVLSVFLGDGPDPRLEANAREVKARGSKVLVIAPGLCTAGAAGVADYSFALPACSKELTPLAANMVTQLLAYYLAVARGKNPDRPVNLAKCVTV